MSDAITLDSVDVTPIPCACDAGAGQWGTGPLGRRCGDCGGCGLERVEFERRGVLGHLAAVSTVHGRSIYSLSLDRAVDRDLFLGEMGELGDCFATMTDDEVREALDAYPAETPALRLARHGLSLRRRELGADLAEAAAP